MTIFLRFISVCALTALLSSCGTEEPGDGTPTSDGTASDTGTQSSTDTDTTSDTGVEPDSDDYYPLAVGAAWTYVETDAYNTKTTFKWEIKSKTNITLDNGVGAKDVFVWENTLSSISADGKTQYIGDDGTRAVRYRQVVADDTGTPTKQRDYAPGFLRFDRGKRTKGTKWTETITVYENTMSGAPITQESVSYNYEVMAVDESVTVPAGTFKCLVVQRSALKGGDLEVKQYYYAKGVGKVKEITEGTEQEELTEYSFASR